MNILIIPSWYSSKNNSIKGSFFREQAIALKKAGHHVIILNATYKDRTGYFDSDNYKLRKYYDEGVLVYSYVTPAFGITRTKRIMFNHFLRRLERLFRKIQADGEQVDVIHAHSFIPAGYGASVIGKKHNIPVVITEHASSIINKSLSAIEVSYFKKSIELSNAIICVGEGLKQSIIELTGTKKYIEVIPNIVSPLFQFKHRNRINNEFTFCSVGNLNIGKRFGPTISAFTSAFKGNSQIKLKIIGEGEQYTKLKNQIDSLGMRDQISLLGVLPREKVAYHMQNSDAFVLASAFETFGVVYIEALACGKPVIGTRNGGADSIINQENGILIDVDNENQLTEAMREMVGNYDKYKKEEISAITIKKYGEKSITNKLNVIYEGCIQRC
ncbi:glycosyltransferase [Neobacillus sp. SCS-31]|uniref:glycosyltransferase n=1 Tax=Neobacillus oceani TaxID=3115292 RepID=UPI0039059F22